MSNLNKHLHGFYLQISYLILAARKGVYTVGLIQSFYIVSSLQAWPNDNVVCSRSGIAEVHVVRLKEEIFVRKKLLLSKIRMILKHLDCTKL